MKCTVLSSLWSCLRAQLVFLSSRLLLVLIMLLQGEVCLGKLSSNKSCDSRQAGFSLYMTEVQIMRWKVWVEITTSILCLWGCGASASSISEGQNGQAWINTGERRAQ